MKIQKLIACLLFFSTLTVKGQSQYILDLKNEEWNIKPTLFYISEVMDERKDKSNAGQVLAGSKSTKAVFKNSLEADLLKLISASMEQDTTKVPLVLSFERFDLKETGNPSHHKAILDFSVKIYRISNDKKFTLYQVNGKPEFDIRGTYPLAHEKNIRESVKNVLSGFNEWINKNPDQPLLAKNVKVLYDSKKVRSESEKSDTLKWDENYKLSWTDFKGAPGASSFMAQSNCIFSYRAETKVEEGTLKLIIYMNACFDRKTSWVMPAQHKDALLAHEQLHFDICELNIRWLKNKITLFELDPLEFDKQINTLFNDAWKEYQKQQQVYDEETEHGIVEVNQKKWESEIGDQLKNISPEGILQK